MCIGAAYTDTDAAYTDTNKCVLKCSTPTCTYGVCEGEDEDELSEDPFHNHAAGNIFLWLVLQIHGTSLTHS